MSLVAWFPLNGTKSNKGIIDNSLNWTTEPTYVNDRCTRVMTSGKATLTGKQTAKILGYKFSYCAWIKVTSSLSPGMIFGNDGMGNVGSSAVNNNRHYTLFFYPTRNDFHWYWQIDSTNVSTAQGAMACGGRVTGFFPDNVWVHVAITYGDGYVRIYKNGVQVYSEANTNINPSTISTFEYATTVFHNQPGREISDVRIYNHVLSPKEVSEVAKGLCCHYKLDSACGGRPGNKNLLKNTIESTGVYQSFYTSGYTTATNETDESGVGIRKFVVNADPAGWHFTGISSHHFNLSVIQPGTTYTISFWLKTTYSGRAQISILRGDATNLLSSYAYFNTTGDSKWHRYVTTITTISDFSSVQATGQVLYIWGLEFAGTYEYKLFKMEEGSEATDWCPNESDKLYKKLGYDGVSIEECSGFVDNTYNSSSSNLVLTNDSLIHNTCFKLNSTTGAVVLKAPWEPNTEISECTFSIWASTTAVEGNYWNFAYNRGIRIRPGYSYSDHSECYIDVIYYDGNTQSDVTLFKCPGNLIGGTVHNIVLTWKSGTFKVYVDGEFKRQATIESTIIKPNLSTCILGSFNGTTECQVGRSSDFRIFSTALSDEAIRELYQARECISNKGDVIALDLMDDTTSTKLGKSGILHSSSHFELPVLFDQTIYKEPDGSLWVKTFHHYQPASHLFSSTDDFTVPFFKNNSAWWNMTLFDYVDKYEIMIKQTQGGNEYKYRWIQNDNPMTATFYSVAADLIKPVEGDGYTSSTYGGICHENVYGSYLTANNGQISNWWGAIGAWRTHESGIPGYNAQIITSGYLDVYLRIDNNDNKIITELNKASIAKQGGICSRNFIEI